MCDGSSRAHRAVNGFWGELDARYAVFAERLGDRSWRQIGMAACAEVGAGSGDPEVFRALVRMARALDDGHTTLRAPSLGRRADGWVSAYPWYPEVEAAELVVEAAYLDDPLSWAARDWIAWGRAGDVGYLSLTSMDGLSRGGSERGDVAAAQHALDRALAELRGTRGLVVDVRANEGGWDAVSLEIARWFAGPDALAWSRQWRDGPDHDDLGPWRHSRVAASGPDAYAAPVVLLTSGGTFSAAETFTLAMRVRSHVTVMGEPTSGHYSDLVEGDALPGGWRFTFSGQRYRAADGQVHEGRGTPPDIAMAVDPDALAAGRDPMFEAAAAWLSAR